MSAHSLLASLPNLISLGRLVLVPIIVALIVQPEWWLAFLLFVVAGISDAVDGWLAKRFDLRTEVGAYLDPIADKALLVSIYLEAEHGGADRAGCGGSGGQGVWSAVRALVHGGDLCGCGFDHRVRSRLPHPVDPPHGSVTALILPC